MSIVRALGMPFVSALIVLAACIASLAADATTVHKELNCVPSSVLCGPVEWVGPAGNVVPR